MDRTAAPDGAHPRPVTGAAAIRHVRAGLRRYAAVWIALLTFLGGSALLDDPESWTGRWMQVVSAHRDTLTVLWPFVAAATAWSARGEPAGSRWSRAPAIVAGAAGAYLLALGPPLAGAFRTAAYRPAGALWTPAVGTLAVAAAALLGLGLGRRLPYRLTAPVLLVAGFAAITVLDVLRAHSSSRLLLLSPSAPWAGDFVTVSGRATTGQAVWFAALAATGIALLAARRPPRWAPALPVVLGLAVVLPVLPPATAATPPDPVASTPVCTADLPRVCVTRVYEPALPQLAGPARTALRMLNRLPEPPRAVVQGTGDFGFPLPQDPRNVTVHLTLGRDGTLVQSRSELVDQIVEGAGTWNCGGTDTASWDRVQAARTVAGAWIENRTAPPDDPWPPTAHLTTTAWTRLRSLPAAEQLTRIAALRDAGLRCRPDLYEILTAPAPKR